MKYFLKTFTLSILLLSAVLTNAQTRKYSVANAHSHNDYMNDQPFQRAFKNGYGSIEADIFPVNGILCVAHSKGEIQLQRTLKSLYLEPLLKELKRNKSRQIKLLVDIKEDHKLCLDLLMEETKHLRKYLSTPQNKNQVTILISGERPAPAEYKNYPGYIFFDDDLKIPHTVDEWVRVGQVSLPFTKYSSWKGDDSIKTADKNLLKLVIDSVHLAGKTIRFWAAPDNEASWIMQMQLGVDLVGTDKIDELTKFLQRRSKQK